MVSERLKMIRKEIGLTQDEFSDSTNIKRTTYIGYEKGSSLPNSDFLFELNTRYSININWLVNGEGKMYVEKSIYEKSPLVSELEKAIDQRVEEKSIEILSQLDLLKKQIESLRAYLPHEQGNTEIGS